MKIHDLSINSPNFGKTRSKNKIKYVIIHYTGMQSEVVAIKRLVDNLSKVSCHYLINNQGKIIKIIPENLVAWHAGKSRWKKSKSLNSFSIGIELTNPGHQFNYKNFHRKQILSLIKVSKYLIKKYKINKKNFLGHSDIAPLRKKDPGEKFPWEYISKSNIGFWHKLKKTYLIKNRKRKINDKDKRSFFKLIKKIGYQTKFNIKKSIYEKKLTQAFQRRFRPELVSGILDKECLIIAKNLVF